MEKFSTEEVGYNKDEVKKFVSSVTREYENLLNKIYSKDKKIENLEYELNEYKNNIYKAEEEANEIIEKAKDNASIILNDALIEAEKINN